MTKLPEPEKQKDEQVLKMDDFLEYLDGAIRYWRRMKELARMKKTMIVPTPFKTVDECKCYLDAFQSIRLKFFGEALPPE